MIPTIDFETYSEAGYIFNPASGRFQALLKGKPGLKGINASTYARHPSTRVICLAYDLGAGTKLWTPGGMLPVDLFWYIGEGGLIEAHNSIFEFYIWNFATKGWPPLPLRQLRCSMAKANAHGLPGALGKISDILQADEKKDKRGGQLIQLLSKPKNPTKACAELFRSAAKYPGLYTEMYSYCMQDVKSEISISGMIPELSPSELELWFLDQEINTRGVAIDVDGMNGCIAIVDLAKAKYTDELQQITDGAVQAVDEIVKGSAGDKWMLAQGVNMCSFAKPNVKTAVDAGDLAPKCHRVLEIRQILGGASIKKLFAMQRTLGTDGRIGDLFLFCGAGRTGRWAGRGPQPQNLKNSGPDCIVCTTCGYVLAVGQIMDEGVECPACGDMFASHNIEWGDSTTEAALSAIATLDLDLVEHRFGDAIDIVASCLRGLFVAADGYDLIGSDYSAIEAVVLAMMAGETWRIEVFRTHGKIYEASAVQPGITLEMILAHKRDTGTHHPLRKKGKVRELALGYGGWIGALKAFGGDKIMTDDEMKASILEWRDTSPAIVEFWGGQWRKDPWAWRFEPELYGLEGACLSAILNPGQCYSFRGITYGVDQQADVLYCLLPSGRKLAYHEPRLTRGQDPRGLDVYIINYMGWNSDSTKGPVGWLGMELYGGKLCENVCQAIARDIMAAALLRVNAAGYRPVLHVHDEIISEVPHGFGSVEEFEALMMVKEPWFADWPIKAAGGWRGRRFRK
jgi:DNA polymerase